ncbi:hypothetical protein GTQ99_07315 [Kineococcus sp. T13]|uniref:hypothetical protein n=1 Tax=Kineococcus vitellinus TaxID=2696565 RepID=UPI00141262DC|nr:hypothetical protein [Kineococcus vitellinus]NAZ75232.1 hypothetical protein [Kineococcus vitellinus]
MSVTTKVNAGFEASFSAAGQLVSLTARTDPHRANWVIDPGYLHEAGYEETDKLFGEFTAVLGGRAFTSGRVQRGVDSSAPLAHQVSYELPGAHLQVGYDLGADPHALDFTITLENTTEQAVVLEQLAVWTPFAYVMFRDADVRRNMHHSVAVFPSISPDYTKLALHRRSGDAPHLGVYQRTGRTLSVGTWCAYTNRFFENASPSLDGMLFHQLVLAGGYPPDQEPLSDFIYPREALTLAAEERRVWTYRIAPYADPADFATQAHRLGHPLVDSEPLTVLGEALRLRVQAPQGRTLTRALVRRFDGERVHEVDVSGYLTEDTGGTEGIEGIEGTEDGGDTGARADAGTGGVSATGGRSLLQVPTEQPGEHQVLLTFDDASTDQVIVNVMAPLNRLLAARSQHIADVLYEGPHGQTPHAFRPVSNQGESLGKLSLVLAQNLLGTTDVEQVRKVEQSVVHYVRPKWFLDGDFRTPRRLYGDFYRVMDFEYIGHLLYLLSRFEDGVLAEHPARTYLQWAADVFEVRVNPALHEDERGKEESRMLGVYFLYVDDLLRALDEQGLQERRAGLAALWADVLERLAADSATCSGAVTEHFYDNAGFGPTAGALTSAGKLQEGQRYAQLLEANIGFSNDFRAQAPDRWWEALSFMVHSLWGGLAAAAMLKVYEALPETRYLLAAYRATVAVLYCYDSAATATALRLGPGEAASTYSIAGPHLNRPDLSRNRFGQSTFAKDGGIFTRLFPDDSISPDWDMGEELVAYLGGFGRKTFLYEDTDGRLRVVNGSIERTERGHRIVSYAPHPREFHFHQRGIHLVLQEPARVVDLIDGAFVPASTTQSASSAPRSTDPTGTASTIPASISLASPNPAPAERTLTSPATPRK